MAKSKKVEEPEVEKSCFCGGRAVLGPLPQDGSDATVQFVHATGCPKDDAKPIPAEDVPDIGNPVTPRLYLTPDLIAVIRANRAGRATNSDLQALWSALYTAAGPEPKPVARVVGK